MTKTGVILFVAIVALFILTIWMARDPGPPTPDSGPSQEVRAEIVKNKAKEDCRKIRAMKRDGAFSDASGLGRDMITDALVKCDAAGFTE